MSWSAIIARPAGQSPRDATQGMELADARCERDSALAAGHQAARRTMTAVLWIGMLVVAFAGCRWSGRLLDHHYADRQELAAILTIALCVFAPLVLASSVIAVDGVLPKLSLAVAVCAGLLTGREGTAA